MNSESPFGRCAWSVAHAAFVVTPLLLSLVAGCGQGGEADADVQAPPRDASADTTIHADGGFSDGASDRVNDRSVSDASSAIPASYFGMHVNHMSFPVRVPYGYFRGWDSAGGQWQTIEVCNPAMMKDAGGCFEWTSFDEQMAFLKDAGVDEALYTLSRTPAWASPATPPGPVPCDYGGNTCLPPSDLASDGSGTDSMWIGWVAGLGDHVNAPGYASTHAHIHMYEPWNEFYRSQTLSGSMWTTYSYQGTYAQIVRMTEDLRCVIKGVGSIHNSPTVGHVMACSELLTALGRAAVDPDALITTPSGEFAEPGQEQAEAIQNFLYCSGSSPADAGCTTGDAGSVAVDVINLHLYPTSYTPEEATAVRIPALQALLGSTDLAKPLICGEGSWGPTPSSASIRNIWGSDVYARAGFIPRYLALNWSAGLSQTFWYAYDNQASESYPYAWGQLYAKGADGGDLLKPEATAWTTTHGWLLGAVPTAMPFCKNIGTVYTCDFSKGGKIPARLVWDASFGPQTMEYPDGGGVLCESYEDPWICGDGAYTDTKGFSSYAELSGAGAKPIPATGVVIGAVPVLLE